MANDARNTRDANPPRPNVVILNPPTAWRPLRNRMQTLRVFRGTAVLLLYMAKKRSKNSRDGGI